MPKNDYQYLDFDCVDPSNIDEGEWSSEVLSTYGGPGAIADDAAVKLYECGDCDQTTRMNVLVRNVKTGEMRLFEGLDIEFEPVCYCYGEGKPWPTPSEEPDESDNLP